MIFKHPADNRQQRLLLMLPNLFPKSSQYPFTGSQFFPQMRGLDDLGMLSRAAYEVFRWQSRIT
jgi:hypothetical protein